MKAAFKKITLLTIITLFFSCTNSDNKSINQTSCLSTDLQNGIIAFYPFSNGSINDFSGNNYNLTNSTTASPGIDRNGNPNCAYQFNNANNEFLKYTNPTFLDDLPTNNFSISFWYKSNDLLGSSGAFISRGNQQYCNSSFGEWSIGYVNNVVTFGVTNGIVHHYGVENTTWEHIVITSNNSNNQLFVNGVLISTGSGINGTSCPILNQGDLFIGRLYDGLIDDIIIYDRVVTPTEITELYNLIPCCE